MCLQMKGNHSCFLSWKNTSLLGIQSSFMSNLVLQNILLCSSFFVFTQAVLATSRVTESNLSSLPLASQGFYPVLERMPFHCSFSQTDLWQFVFMITSWNVRKNCDKGKDAQPWLQFRLNFCGLTCLTETKPFTEIEQFCRQRLKSLMFCFVLLGLFLRL